MQAILILAHKNIQQVVELSRKLNSNFNVYIHFDKKMTLDDNFLKILENENIRYISQEDVKWGSWSIVRATIALMNLALSDKDNRYFHLISGQDWPIINSQEIYDFFEDKNSIYMERYSADRVKKSHEEIINWQKYYYYYDVINRRKLYGKIFHRLTIKLQGLLKINKFKKLKDIKNERELRYLFSDLHYFLASPRSSVTGLDKIRRKSLDTLHEHGYKFVTKKNLLQN